MNPRILSITEIEQLHLAFRALRSHDGFGYWFRGQANSEWELLPKAGRDDYYRSNNADLGRFNAWSRLATAYYSLPTSRLEQLAIAQHHGLATRMLDWTKNPLVACFFACIDLLDHDGAVYAYETPETLLDENHALSDLEKFSGVYGYMPRSINPRLLAQKGLFSIHCDSRHKISAKPSRINPENPNLVKIKIPKAMKTAVLNLLYDYGIDEATIFPDLDGLSDSINKRTVIENRQRQKRKTR